MANGSKRSNKESGKAKVAAAPAAKPAPSQADEEPEIVEFELKSADLDTLLSGKKVEFDEGEIKLKPPKDEGERKYLVKILEDAIDVLNGDADEDAEDEEDDSVADDDEDADADEEIDEESDEDEE